MLFDNTLDVLGHVSRSCTRSRARSGLTLLLATAMLGGACSEMAPDGSGAASEVVS